MSAFLVAAVVAIVFVPQMLLLAATLFHNHVQPTLPFCLGIALAGFCFASVLLKRKGADLANAIVLMLQVYHGAAFVDAASNSPAISPLWGFAHASAGFLAVLVVRRGFGASPFQIPDFVRQSAVLLLFTWLLFARGNRFGGWEGAVLTAVLILWPVVATLLSSGLFAGVTPAQFLIGIARWIMGFAVGGSLIIGAAGGGMRALYFAVLAGLLYLLFWYAEEKPAEGWLQNDLRGVAGSGVATALRLIIIQPSHLKEPLLVAYAVACLVAIVLILYRNSRPKT